MVAFVLLVAVTFIHPVKAQSRELQQRLTEIKQAMAQNKQALAQYTWVHQVIISLKGEQKKQEHFRAPRARRQAAKDFARCSAQPQESGGRLKRHVVEKKKEEYADQMKALAQQHIPPDKDLLQQAYQQGNVTMGSVPENPNAVKLVIRNYLKQGDSMTLIFDKAQKALLQDQVASYIDDPKDAMNLTVQFSKMPNGPNHVSSMVIGRSQQATERCHTKLELPAPLSRAVCKLSEAYNARRSATINQSRAGPANTAGPVLACLPTPVAGACHRWSH